MRDGPVASERPGTCPGLVLREAGALLRSPLVADPQGWTAARAGVPVAEVAAEARRDYRQRVGGLLRHDVWAAAQRHRCRGGDLILWSAAPRVALEPLLDDLQPDTVVCPEAEADGALLTGALTPAPTLEDAGLGAAQLIEAAAADRTEPLPVRGLRTAGLYAGLATGLSVGAALAAANRSRDAILGTGAAIGADLALGLAGVEVRVLGGREHLWSSRPCVFVFNHESNIDPIVVMKLVRGDITGVAKREARNIPVFGPLFRAADVAFIDRSDGARARQALAPAVEKLRRGTSLIIAPEGTRSPTPRIGPFKRGAFHIARQAQVPIVPLVLHGAGRAWPRGATFVAPASVDVEVLPPITTAGWAARDVGQHADTLHATYTERRRAWYGSLSES